MISFHKKELRIAQPLFQWAKNSVKELHLKELEGTKRQAKILKEELSKLEAKKERLRTLFIEEVISLEEYKKDFQKLDMELETMEKEATLSENWYKQMNRLLDAMYHFEDIIKKANYSEKRTLLGLLSSNLVWDEQKLYILKANWLKTYIEGRKTVLSKYPEFEPENQLNFKGSNDVLDINCPVLWGWLDNIRKKLLKKPPLL